MRKRKTLREIAEEEDEKVRTGREAEGYVRVASAYDGEIEHAIILRFSMEEIEVVRKKAKARGLRVDEYIRRMALEAPDTESRAAG